jgi:hypothetical protein
MGRQHRWPLGQKLLVQQATQLHRQSMAILRKHSLK